MKRTSKLSILLAITAFLCCFACAQKANQGSDSSSLVGAWRSSVNFQTGMLASMKGFEFMYVFNSGGTMTESSNYDAAPPVPPAYGIWKPLGSNEYQARYEFFITRTPTQAETAAGSVGWLPGGRGLLIETIRLSGDGNSFTSTIRYEILDQAGKPTAGSGTGEAQATRMTFK